MMRHVRGLAERGASTIGCLVAFIVVVVLVVGGGYACVKVGLGKFGEAVGRKVRDDPAILEHIGIVEEVKFNLTGTGVENSEEDAPEKILIFDIRGSKGAGELQIILTSGDGHPPETPSDDEDLSFRRATLRMADGKTYELTSVVSKETPKDAPKETPKEAPKETDAPPAPPPAEGD